uniref:Cilia- and flagella-associated protein 61 N-terminal domain-containing protein n=1 Tax=Trypanosoma congolense (strain IL3000) TaxID=1068625 RepID=G0UPI1_TRYCI|nr:conserved hypothetical protein [Trypanosoma congolense IL3000]
MEARGPAAPSGGKLPLVFRRSHTRDRDEIAQLRRTPGVAQCAPPSTLFPWKTESDFASLIENSVISISAVSNTAGKIVGFICLDDVPHTPSIPGNSWENMVPDVPSSHSDRGHPIAPYNTLWVKALLAPPSTALRSDSPNPTKEELDLRRKLLLFGYSAEVILQRMLHTALDNLPAVKNLLVYCPPGCSYPVLHNVGFREIPMTDSPYEGTLLHVRAAAIVPQLILRLGIVEDYDDFVVRILCGEGLITSLPEEFYLDELLKDQTEYSKVIVAEDNATHHVVGIMCLEASFEDQQVVSRQYYTEPYGKFRPIYGQLDGAKSGATPNLVRIKFFYIDPAYELRAGSFLPIIYKEFPFVEYVIITLPYKTEKPPFLWSFDHVPLRKYHPRNSEGEMVPPPDGLWVNCKYTEDRVTAIPIKKGDDKISVKSFLDEPHGELSQHQISMLMEDMQLVSGEECVPEEVVSDVVVMSFTTSFAITRGGNEKMSSHVIGVASARKVSIEEMYKLRANYNIDKIVNYYTKTAHDYKETDVTLSPEEGRKKFFRNDVRGLLIRSFYVRPVYRSHIPFFVRELLRRADCEMALVLEGRDTIPFNPLLQQLLRIQPRRVLEKTRRHEGIGRLGQNIQEDVDDEDAAALGCLFAATRRVLGDRKKYVHTRIVVVGAGTTGLTFLYRLISVPYICFTNLVLVSTDGMPKHPNQLQHLWGADGMELLEREHMALTVGNPFRIIHGSVVDIETTQRFVVIDDSIYEPYDYVVLTTGRQFGVPLSISNLVNPTGQKQLARAAVPSGVLPLSGSLAVDKLQQSLYELDRNPQNISNVIVYGSGLDAFAIATSIINLGFSPQRVVVVSPEVTNPFFDQDAFECVTRMWNSLGTNTLHGYKITRLEYDEDGNSLTTVVISPVAGGTASNDGEGGTDARSAVEINCSLIVCCEDKDIDSNVLSTLNRRSIVFDGRVTVESNYLTTNPCVYASGPVAMFTRRYGTTNAFDEFNARDVGTNLADVILGTLGFDEFSTPNLRSCTAKEDELHAAHNELYSKVLDENGSRSANYAADVNPSSNGNNAHEIAKQNQLEQQQKLPVYTTPISSRIRLPGNYVFFSSRCVFFDTTKCLRLHYSCVKDNKPFVDDIAVLHQIMTPVADEKDQDKKEQNLLVIYLNKQTRLIDAVVYFGNGSPEMHNYVCLIGLPHSLLNLVYRYNEAQADPSTRERTCSSGDSPMKSSLGSEMSLVVENSGLNLMEYLRLPKLQIIFYDRFIEFYQQLRATMQQHEDTINMKKNALARMEMTSSINASTREAYLDDLTKMQKGFAQKIQYELIKFLHENKESLPQIMYLPDITQHVNREKEQQTCEA